MKTTINLPEGLARKAEVEAAARGQTLPQFVAAAVKEKIGVVSKNADKTPWMKWRAH